MKSASPLVRFSVAVVIAGAALLFRSALDPVIGNAARYTLFFLGVLVSAWYGGFFPGLLTTAILMLGGGYLRPKPPVVVVGWLAQAIPPIAFGTTALACCVLIEALRSAQDKSARNEQAAREAEGRLRSVVENTQEAIFSVDRDFRFTFVNDRTLEIGRKTREEMIGARLWDLFPASLEEVTHSELQGAMQHRAAVSFEGRYPPYDIWFECDAYPSADGGLNMFLRDVGTKKRALLQAAEHAERARREHALLETVVDRLPVGVMIASSSGAVEMINSTANEIFRTNIKPGDNLAALASPSIRTEGGEPLAPENWPLTRAFKGEVVTNFEVRFDRGGKPAVIICNAVPMRNEAGEVDRALGAVFDVTEHRAAQTALRETEKRLRKLFDSPMIGIISGDREQITEANAAFLSVVGYDRSELPLNWRAVTPPDFAAQDASAVEQMNEKGFCDPFEKDYMRKDGRRIPLLLGLAALEPGSWSPWIGWVLDLSERRRLEERLREAAKLESVGLLAGGVAHDFNNLLTGVLGNATLALDTVAATSPARPLMDSVIRATERAADLTRQLLAYAGKGRFIIEPVDVSEIVREISELIRTSIPRSVQVHMELAPSLPPVEADGTQIQQLLMNLVINAAEAIGDQNGSVRITTVLQKIDQAWLRSSDLTNEISPGDYICIEVQDTGSGMDDETRKRIFDPFFTTKFTGRGLGLAAAMGIVRGHRGAIKVYSTPGEGSTFKVLLPALTAAARFPERRPEASTTARGAGAILVVDDEDVVRRTATSALQRYGYTVLTAENGREAVDVYRSMADRITMILLDMTMPVMGGEEALGSLKAINPAVRVLLSSGFNEVEATRRFTGKGLAGFIQKPYTAAALAQKVRQVLDTSSSVAAG